MGKDELLAMLGVKPEASKPTTGKAASGPDLIRKPLAERSDDVGPTYLELDAWDRDQGRILKERHTKFTNLVGIDEHALADFHAAAFLLEPKASEIPCGNERRAEYMQTMMDSPDYKTLHSATALNALASEMASVQMADKFHELMMEDQKRQAQAAKGKPNPERDAMRSKAACHRAVGKALAEATKEVDELNDSMASLGCGPGQGGDGKLNTSQVSAIFQQIKNNHQLRRIMDLAGRYRRLAQSKQRRKVCHGYDDMVGVELSGDVGRVLPHELVQLADEDLELNALRRLVEKQSLSRQYEGMERVGKGPIVVCVDESGSMSGEPVANAKAFALAMAWIARHQNRYCCLVGYSGGTDGTFLTLPPNRWSEIELLGWLEHFFSGGTDMDVPLGILPGKWQELGVPKGKTDLILITDAIVRLPGELAKSFLDWKAKEQVKAISLIIGHSAGELASVSDETHLINRISVDDAAIERCLSI